MERVLITGANGFIGRAVTALAAKEKDWQIYRLVSGIKTSAPPLQTPNIQTVSADLRDEKQCDALIKNVQPTLMLHLAWSLEDHNFLHSDKNIQWLEISLCLLRAFKKYGGMRFIFSGSSAEYISMI